MKLGGDIGKLGQEIPMKLENGELDRYILEFIQLLEELNLNKGRNRDGLIFRDENDNVCGQITSSELKMLSDTEKVERFKTACTSSGWSFEFELS